MQRLWNEKADGGLAPRTIRQMRAVLVSALDHALARGRVGRNVAALTAAPPVRPHPAVVLDPEQAMRLLNAAEGTRLEALYVVTLALGRARARAEHSAIVWPEFNPRWSSALTNCR